MATLIEAVLSARRYLNDEDAIVWSDMVLISRAHEALNELSLELALNGIPVSKTQTVLSVPIVVPAGTTSLGSLLPSDLVEPLSVSERAIGESVQGFVMMTEKPFVPMVVPANNLYYWTWQSGQIQFVGCTENREIIIRYKKNLAIPSLNTSELPIPFAELYVGPRAAALCQLSRGQDSSTVESIARLNLEKIIRLNVQGQQQPVRRRGYRRAGLSIRGITRPLYISGGGTGGVDLPLTLVAPNELPDGFRTQFSWATPPRYVIYNGQWRFEGVGYIRVVNVITLIDGFGVPIVPLVGDVIMAVL